MRFLVGLSSALVAAGAGLLGLVLILSPAQGGFFPGLGAALGEMVLEVGNLASFLLNLLYWFSFGRPKRLGCLVLVQLLPALFCALWLGQIAVEDWQADRASDQQGALFAAIEQDDPQRLRGAWQDCGSLCRDRFGPAEQLLVAAEHGARRVAAYLVGEKVAVTSGLGAPETAVWTCEGSYLPGRDALSVAVARDDAELVRMLLPASDGGARRRAMWLAARLDRFDFMQVLAAAGVPLSIRGEILDSNDTLLVAAASGAALQAGRWLVEQRHMPVDAIADGPDPYSGTAPVAALMRFVDETGSPRAAPFLRMLAEHGADVDAARAGDGNALQEAVRVGRKDEAVLLLSVGADAGRLAAAQRRDLAALLAGPDTPPPVERQREGCVKP